MSQLYECDWVGSPFELMLTHLERENDKRRKGKRPTDQNIRFRPSDAAWALENGEDKKGKGNRGCRRKLAYTYYGIPQDKPTPEQLLRMTSGTWAHDQIRGMWHDAGIKLRGWDPETNEEKLWESTLEVSLPGGHKKAFPVRGKADGLDVRPCPEGRERNVVEIKTGGDGMMAQSWADGIAPLLAFAEANLSAVELERDWIYFAYFRQGEAAFQFWAQPNLDLYAEVMDGFRVAAEQVLRGKIESPRGFGTNKPKKPRELGMEVHPLQWQCGNCPFMRLCWQNAGVVSWTERGKKCVGVLDPNAEIETTVSETKSNEEPF